MHKISWLNMPGYKGETWNPIIGCSKVSDGCQNCYAERDSRSGRLQQFERYQNVLDENGNWNGRTVLHNSTLEKPLRWTKPRMIFVCSMGDLFHENTPDEWIDKVFAVMALCPQHVFIVLTKREKRMEAYFKTHKVVEYPANPPSKTIGFKVKIFPLQNVWLGVTVENQEQAEKRIPHLLKTPAAVRFVSCEPMLDTIDLYYWFNYGNDDNVGVKSVIDWMICGCESGKNRRQMKQEWAYALAEQSQDHGVPFFMKQMEIDGRVEKDMSKFPESLQVREWPNVSRKRCAIAHTNEVIVGNFGGEE